MAKASGRWAEEAVRNALNAEGYDFVLGFELRDGTDRRIIDLYSKKLGLCIELCNKGLYRLPVKSSDLAGRRRLAEVHKLKFWEVFFNSCKTNKGTKGWSSIPRLTKKILEKLSSQPLKDYEIIS